MFKTRITELFGIEYPIVGGCMMHISGPEFVAAISNAGALGMMASAMFDTQEKFRQAVRRAKSLTDGSLGFRRERPHIVVLRLGESAIARKVEIKALE